MSDDYVLAPYDNRAGRKGVKLGVPHTDFPVITMERALQALREFVVSSPIYKRRVLNRLQVVNVGLVCMASCPEYNQVLLQSRPRYLLSVSFLHMEKTLC